MRTRRAGKGGRNPRRQDRRKEEEERSLLAIQETARSIRSKGSECQVVLTVKFVPGGGGDDQEVRERATE